MAPYTVFVFLCMLLILKIIIALFTVVTTRTRAIHFAMDIFVAIDFTRRSLAFSTAIALHRLDIAIDRIKKPQCRR